MTRPRPVSISLGRRQPWASNSLSTSPLLAHFFSAASQCCYLRCLRSSPRVFGSAIADATDSEHSSASPCLARVPLLRPGRARRPRQVRIRRLSRPDPAAAPRQTPPGPHERSPVARRLSPPNLWRHPRLEPGRQMDQRAQTTIKVPNGWARRVEPCARDARSRPPPPSPRVVPSAAPTRRSGPRLNSQQTGVGITFLFGFGIAV